MAVTILEGWWGANEEGCMGVGVVSMWLECEKGGKDDMWRDSAAGLKELLLSIRLLEKSSMLSWDFLLFLDLLDIFLFLVWMPSFFMVRGRLICSRKETEKDGRLVFCLPRKHSETETFKFEHEDENVAFQFSSRQILRGDVITCNGGKCDRPVLKQRIVYNTLLGVCVFWGGFKCSF